jgi:hypothetical protein
LPAAGFKKRKTQGNPSHRRGEFLNKPQVSIKNSITNCNGRFYATTEFIGGSELIYWLFGKSYFSN